MGYGGVGGEQVRRRAAAGDGSASGLGLADQTERARRRELAKMQRRAGFLDQAKVARDRHRLGDRGGGGQAEPRRHFAVGRDRAVGQSFVLSVRDDRSEEHTYELQSLMRSSYAVFCLTKKKAPQN